MCGIAGVITVDNTKDFSDALAAMREALVHRGPNDEGTEWIQLDGCTIGMAHTRLAILDTSRNGHQPMYDPKSNSWIVYNGEIYNHLDIRRQLPSHPFRSASDTETILRGWAAEGDKLVVRLRGIFAFGIYDGRKRHFWLVRDRLGVKPLYISQIDDKTWLFASEVRALLASNLIDRRLSKEALNSYLAFGAVPAPFTFVDGIEGLLPGEIVRFDVREKTESLKPLRWRYWRPNIKRVFSDSVNRSAVVGLIRDSLLEVTRQQTLSDVPVGVFLSGGLDSAAIVASLAYQGMTVSTFSVGFEEPRFDESVHARTIARQYGTEHHSLVLRPKHVFETFEQGLSAYDQPSIDGLNSFFLSKAVREAGITVALSGLGGDELFAGYPYFRIINRVQSVFGRAAAQLLLSYHQFTGSYTSQFDKLRRLLRGRTALERYIACRHLYFDERRRALLADDCFKTKVLPDAVEAELQVAVNGLDAVNAQSILEISLYMSDMLLRDTDQMSMANSLEVRVPLLDHKLVELVAGLPGHLKIAPGKSSRLKGLLADAIPHLPASSAVRRPKMGFVLPWEQWLRVQLRDLVSAIFADHKTIKTAGLRHEAVWSIWTEFEQGGNNVRYSEVFGLLNLLSWVKHHRMEL